MSGGCGLQYPRINLLQSDSRYRMLCSLVALAHNRFGRCEMGVQQCIALIACIWAFLSEGTRCSFKLGLQHWRAMLESSKMLQWSSHRESSVTRRSPKIGEP